jgi:hypothetical protein
MSPSKDDLPFFKTDYFMKAQFKPNTRCGNDLVKRRIAGDFQQQHIEYLNKPRMSDVLRRSISQNEIRIFSPAEIPKNSVVAIKQ